MDMSMVDLARSVASIQNQLMAAMLEREFADCWINPYDAGACCPWPYVAPPPPITHWQRHGSYRLRQLEQRARKHWYLE